MKIDQVVNAIIVNRFWCQQYRHPRSS